MLNPFPDLLTYGFFAPTLLRAAAGLVFAYVAMAHWRRREELAAMRYPLVGGGMWVVWLAVLIEGAVALGLLLGYGTQVAALVGALASLKFFIWKRRYPRAVPLSRIASALLIIICLSLLLTGSGAVAFDIRL